MNVATEVSALQRVAHALGALAAKQTTAGGGESPAHATAVLAVLDHALAFLAAVDASPASCYEASNALLRQCAAVPTTVLDGCVGLSFPGSHVAGATAAAAACCAQLTAIALRLSVNSAKLAAAGGEGCVGSAAGSPPLSVEQAKELGGAALRSAGTTASRVLGSAEMGSSAPWSPATPALLLLLRGFTDALALHPATFRRGGQDALLLAVATSTVFDAAVCTASARLASRAVSSAFRSGSGGGSLPSLIRGLLEGAGGAHLAAIQAVAAYAPPTLPLLVTLHAALLSSCPSDGFAYGRPTDALSHALIAKQQSVSIGGVAVVRRAAGHMVWVAEFVRALVSSPSGGGRLSLPLPLPAVVAYIELLCDAPSAIAGGAAAMQAGAAGAALADPSLGPALAQSAGSLVAAGLRLLASLCTACPGAMRRYRTASARILTRVITGAVGSAGPSRAALVAALGHTAVPSLRPSPSAAVLPLALATVQTYARCVGLGAVSSCPEAAALVRLTLALALALATAGVGVVLCDPAWAPLAHPLATAMGSAPSGPACCAVQVLTTLLSSAPSALPDVGRLRVEQAALVIASAWPGPVMPLAGLVGGAGEKGAVRDAGPILLDSPARPDDVLAPQPKRARGGAEEAAELFSHPPTSGLRLPGGRAASEAHVILESVEGSDGEGGPACLARVTPCATLAAALAALLTAAIASPWACGSTSPFAPHLRLALRALSAGGATAGVAGAREALSPALLLAAPPVPLAALAATMPPILVVTGGREDEEMEMEGGAAHAPPAALALPPVLWAHPPAPPPVSAPAAPVVPTAPRPAHSVPVTGGEEARLAAYDAALGEDFPEL